VNRIHSSCLCVTEWETRQQNGAVTRIGTKRGESSRVRRSDRLLKPQLRCALHFVYCATRLHSFCFLASCRFANCAICSLVAGFVLMVYGYRIIMLRCRWLITPVIRDKISSLISRLFAGTTGVAEILFEQPVRLLRDYRGFHYRGSRNYFLRITRQRPSTGHYQRRADCGHNQQNHGTNNRRLQRKSAYLAIDAASRSQLAYLWLSTYCVAAVTFSGRSAKRGRHPGSATLHGQSAVSGFPSACESRRGLSSSKTPSRGTRVPLTRLRTRFSLRACTCGN